MYVDRMHALRARDETRRDAKIDASYLMCGAAVVMTMPPRRAAVAVIATCVCAAYLYAHVTRHAYATRRDAKGSLSAV